MPLAGEKFPAAIAQRMGLLSEFRYPTKWYSKLTAAILAVGFFALMTAATLSVFLLYRIVTPSQSHTDINLKEFPGHPEPMSFTVPNVGSRAGWFFPGLKSAPTILLCHGYQSSINELMTLATALQDHQYNVFLFDFAGHGSSTGHTTLGFRETRELRAAIEAVVQRGDVDATRFGLWGTNMGGYTAISVAAGDPRVRAVAVESVYNHPEDFVRVLVGRSGLGSLPMIERFAELGFRWLNRSYASQPPLESRVFGLAGVAKLYLEAGDEPALAEATREIFLRSPEPREQALLAHGNYAGMLDDEKRSYENRIISFFLVNLPPSGRVRH